MVANPADLGLAVLGGPQAAAYLSAGLGPGYVNPPTYSSAGTILTDDRPAPAESASTSHRSASPAPVLAEPAQTRADVADRLRRQRFGAVLARRLDPAALARPRGSGHPVMRTHHHRPGLPGTVVKVVVFIVVSAIITSIVISTLLDVNTQAATGYVAQFSNASESAAGRHGAHRRRRGRQGQRA